MIRFAATIKWDKKSRREPESRLLYLVFSSKKMASCLPAWVFRQARRKKLKEKSKFWLINVISESRKLTRQMKIGASNGQRYPCLVSWLHKGNKGIQMKSRLETWKMMIFRKLLKRLCVPLIGKSLKLLDFSKGPHRPYNVPPRSIGHFVPIGTAERKVGVNTAWIAIEGGQKRRDRQIPVVYSTER